MTIQHRDIPDSERHEVKGALSATAGSALFALGGDTTEFRIIDFTDITGVPVFDLSALAELTSISVVDQTTFAADTQTQITFGAADSSDNLSIDALGTVTVATTATYEFDISLSAGRTSGASTTHLFFAEKVNGVIVGPTRCVRLNSSPTNVTIPIQFSSKLTLAMGDTYQLWMVKDTNNDAGLTTRSLPAAAVTAGWPAVNQSATLRSYSYGG